MPSQELEGMFNWGWFVCADARSTSTFVRVEGGSEAGFVLTPSLSALLFVDGLWRIVNEKYGLLIDQFEEEVIPAFRVLAVAVEVEDFSASLPDSPDIERIVGSREGRPVRVNVPRRYAKETLGGLALFLSKAGSSNRDVVVVL